MLDQDAQNLAKAIRQVESGGNPNAKGASGEYGAYQFMPDTWKSLSKKHLGQDVSLASSTLEQQNEVAYKQVKEWKDKGFNPGQIASMWNAGEGHPDAYLDPKFSGTNSKGSKYNVGEYAKNVATAYQSLKTQGGQTNVASPAQASNTQPNLGPNAALASGASGQSSGKKGFVSTALGLAGKAVNTFLPILGDAKNIIQGKNDKSGKQLLADTALSALPFIPGLGEVGLLGRAAEGAGALAKVARVAKVAAPLAEGYGIGSLQNLSEGKSVGESLKPNLSNVGGAALGGLAHGLIKGGGELLDKASGIPENIKPVLSSLSKPELYDQYINAAKARATNIRNASPLELAADYTKKAATAMQQKLKQVGVKVGEAKRVEATKKLQPVDGVLKNLVTNLDEKFGLTISASKTGRKITIENSPGRMKSVLTPADQGRVKTALKQLLTLRKGGNVRQASDVLDNLTNLVDYSKKDLLGHSNDPLEGLLKNIRHDLNGVVGESSPKLAQVKARFHDLSDSLQEISGAGGDNLQRAELLLKRVLAGDKSEASRKVFDIIKKETGIDLVEHAVLADHAIRTIKDPSQVSLLNKMIENVVQGGKPTAFSFGLDAGRGLLQKTLANPEKIGRNLANKKSAGLLPRFVQRQITTQAARLPGLVSPPQP